MILKTIGKLKIFQFELFQKFSQVSNCISTREGGVSLKPYASLNLGFIGGDSLNNVISNRKLLLKTLEIKSENCVFANQTHSGNVTIVSNKDGGKGVYNYDTAISNTDALITKDKNLYLMVLLADCTPIFFFDTIHKIVGIAHSGRMGTVHKIAKATIQKMGQVYGSEIKNIVVGIGPTISGENYFLNQDKVDLLKKSLINETVSLKKVAGGFQFDLATAIFEQLYEIGVVPNNIEKANICTYENPDMFFSERRDKAPTGRFIAAIALK